jgi:hypothetical protein
MKMQLALFMSGLVIISSQASSKGLCINDEKVIQRIIATQKAYKKSDNKYDGYRAVLSQDSDSILIARLIYANVIKMELDRGQKIP